MAYPPHPQHPSVVTGQVAYPGTLKSANMNEILAETYSIYDADFQLYLDEILKMMVSVPPYFCVTNPSTSTNLTITIQKTGAPTALNLQYSKDGFSWTNLTTSVTLAPGSGGVYNKVYLRNSTGRFSTSATAYYTIKFSAEPYCSGKLSSLINYNTMPTTAPAFCFTHLFDGCIATDLSGIELPEQGAGNYAYAYAFANSANLTTVPTLPAISVQTGAYQYMFMNCANLAVAPVLPALSMTPYCYEGMFKGCTSLTASPLLGGYLSKTGANSSQYCYANMFEGCTSLVTPSDLPDETLAEGCYKEMFKGCTSLVRAPKLPAPALAKDCYDGMFDGCSSLQQIICLATQLDDTPTPTGANTTNWARGVFNPGNPPSTPCALYKSAGIKAYDPAEPKSDAWLLNSPNGCPVNWELKDYGDLFAKNVIFENVYEKEVIDPVTGQKKTITVDTGYKATDCQAVIEEISDHTRILAQALGYHEEFKQNRLVAGNGITIENDTISAKDYSGIIDQLARVTAQAINMLELFKQNRLVAGEGITIENDTISTKEINIDDLERVLSQSINMLDTFKQNRLVAGEGIKIENDTISVTAEKVRSAYVKFTDLSGMENALTVSTTATTAHNVLLEYSKNGTDWVSFQPNEDIVFPANGTLYIRNRSGVWTGNGKTYKISCIHEFAVAGDLYALLDYRNPEAPLYLNCFSALFNVSVSQNNCVDASNLRFPTYTADNAMSKMFQYNQKLVVAPKLPATFLSRYCYESMFAYCTSLVVPPLELPARNLEQSCYDAMFNGCTSLTFMPEIKAKALASQCMNKMFMNCKALTEVPESLPATTLAQTCYSQMFQGCISLTHAPQLPAETLALQCYYRMFYGCTSLVESPILPAKELVQNCYTGMFQGCTNLKKITAYADLFHNTTKIGVNTVSWVTNVPEGGVFCKGKDAKVTATATPIKEAWLKDSVDGIPLHWRIEDAEDNKERVIAQALAELNEFKQNRLVAGENVTIENDTISAKTNTTALERILAQALSELKVFKQNRLVAGEGITIENDTISTKEINIDKLERVLAQSIAELKEFKQDRLVAGKGIKIENNTIESNGGDVTKEEFEIHQRVTAQGMAQLDREKMPAFTTGDGLRFDWEGKCLELDGELDTETLEQVIAQGFHQLDTEKENRLVAGEGVDIDRKGGDTVISVSGQATDNQVIAQALAQLERTKQPVLTAGTGIKIDHNVISVVTTALTDLVTTIVKDTLKSYGINPVAEVASPRLQAKFNTLTEEAKTDEPTPTPESPVAPQQTDEEPPAEEKPAEETPKKSRRRKK